MKTHFEYSATVGRVVDGDTLEVTIDLGFRTFIDKVRLRLRGIDTPETWRPRSAAEAEHGRQAKEFVEAIFLENPRIRVITFKHGPSSFARYEADVFYSRADGVEFNLVEALIENDFQKRDHYPD